jgi:hypothetical protein
MITTTNGYLSNEVRDKAQNMLTHGKITALPFGNQQVPFKILMVAKEPTSGPSEFGAVFLDVRLRGDKEASPYFIRKVSEAGQIARWTAQSIWHIPATADNLEKLENFHIYWAAAENPPL